MTLLHQWARYYASLGWHVFPLVPGTKSPLKDSHGSSEATTDLAQIDAWWTAHPHANIGMRPASSGLYVFDVDPRNNGHLSFQQLQAQHGPISSPLCLNSPRGDGGFHLYFRANPSAKYLGEPAPGIDGKFNGYVLLPPSVHPCGKPYVWAYGVDAVPSQVPDWLERKRVERPQVQHSGNVADLTLVGQALANRDPTDYWSWIFAVASVKHWEEHTPGAEGLGYEMVRAWSAQDPRHDDGQFQDKWETFDSFKEDARSLGTLLYEAGLTREQQQTPAAEMFAVPAVIPEPPRALEWTTAPVEGFKGPVDVPTLQAELMTADARGYGARWMEATDIPGLINDAAWRSGGNCELILQLLLTNPLITDSQALRDAIAANCAHRTTWYTIGALTPEQQQTEARGECPRVEVDDGKLVSAFRLCMRALAGLPDVFQRNGRLVWVDPRGTIGEYEHHSLAHELETFVRFEKGAGRPTKCPENLAIRLVKHREFPGVAEIAAAIPMPTARADGSVISEKGLDVPTGLYLLRAGEREPMVLDLAGLQAALCRVWAPFAEFPYDNAASRGVLLASLLTTVCRPALDTSPAFLVNAAAPGTGKTLLSSALMALACGSLAPLALPAETSEQAKTLVAVLSEGPRGVLFDNVDGVLKASPDFCMAMTSAEYKARGLGGLKMIKVANRALWVLNGNNVVLAGDSIRRVLTVGLDSAERPEVQAHAFNPVAVILSNLGQLRGDLLDILHTYRAAGMPMDPTKGFASFDQWNRLVRGCLLWLVDVGALSQGFADDPLRAMQDAQEEDPQTLKLRMMLQAWVGRFGGEPVRLRDLASTPLDGAVSADWVEAYTAVCTYNGRMDESRMQYWLRSVKRKKADGLMFVSERIKGSHAVQWRVASC